MVRKIFILAGYLLLIGIVAVTLSFAVNEANSITCSDVQVSFLKNELIQVKKEEIVRLIHNADKQLMGKELREINADIIEKDIEKHPAIDKAEVYKIISTDSSSYRGILGVRIKHREPVVRIMSVNARYYLDKTGEKIPFSSNYTANVLVVTGDFSEEYARSELLPFVMYLNSNPFWRAQIEQIHVENDGGIVLTPLVGDQIIEMGSIQGYPEKLRNLKAFYQQIMARNNWDKYNKISLKYKNQIIAKKR